MFSNAFGGSYVQVIEWTKYATFHSFIVPALTLLSSFLGSNAFCLKACNPAGAHAADYCQHIYDRIGCAFNAPNAAQDKVFESCDAENADFPGVYTSNGQVVTYTQPPESLGAITTMPYVARVPSSSNCKTFSSAALFTGLPTVSSTPSASSSGSGSATSKPTGSAAATGSAKPASSSNTSDAAALAISGLSLFGVVFSAMFLS